MSQKSKLKKKLALVFNKFIRLRDKDETCISCDGPVQQAGHYWSTSQCPQPSMRFNEDNVHGQCISCNCFKEGNRQGYREGLIKRFGKEILLKLDLQRSLPQTTWTVWEYHAMIKVYKNKCKELSPS